MNIEKPNRQGAAICKIEYRYAQSIASYVMGASPHHRIVTFDEEYWLNIYFSPGTAAYSEPQIPNANGPLFDQQLQMKFPGHMSEHLAYLERMDELPVIVRFSYSDGVQKLMGSPDNPVIFNSAYRDDAKSASDEFKFRCMAPHRAYLYESPDSGGGGGVDPPAEV